MDLTNLIYVVGLFINFEIKLLFYIFLNRFIYFYSISNDTTNQPVQHRLRWLRIRQKLNLKVESIKINWLGFILSQTQTFVGLFFTIYVYNPQKVMEKKATFSQLVMWFTPHHNSYSKGHCLLKASNKGFHMVGCAKCGRVISIPRGIESYQLFILFTKLKLCILIKAWFIITFIYSLSTNLQLFTMLLLVY